MVRNAKINSVNLFVLFSSKENIAQLLHDRYDSPRYALRIPAVSEVLISMITMEQQFKDKTTFELDFTDQFTFWTCMANALNYCIYKLIDVNKQSNPVIQTDSGCHRIE
jgi:hypothetical protein